MLQTYITEPQRDICF